MPTTKDKLIAAFHAGEHTFGSAPRDFPEETWAAIVELSRTNLTDEQISLLAAGPLEDLLAYHGPAFIDRIEREARIHAPFRHLLGGVWNPGPPEIWHRVQQARKTAW